MNPEIIGNRIKALMTIRNIKRSYLAKELGISYNTLTKKLNGQREFGINEIWKIKEVLGLDKEMCANIFFNPKFLIDEENTYSCPEGYKKSGSNAKTKCYKKTTREAYYYCTNKNATLENDRCIVPSTTKFVSYRCPSGYKLSGNQCLKSTSTKDRIKASKQEGTSKTETIWNKNKNLDGWTWTGNTKEE